MAKKGTANKHDRKSRELAEIEAARVEKLTPKGEQVDKYSATTSAYEHEASMKTRKAVKETMSRLGAGKHRNGGGVDTSYTQNREVSWLRFNNRVLDEAFDETVPLFERLKFVEIFGSNLMEWFMIRIGGLSDLASLKHEPVDNKSGLTPSQQLDLIFRMLPPLVERQEKAELYLEGELREHGLTRVTRQTMTDEDLVVVSSYFRKQLSPILSPLMVDPRHPFPNLRNGSLYIVCSLDGQDETGVLGIIEVPHRLPRILQLPSRPSKFRFILLEDIIATMADSCFGTYRSTSTAIIRVTRNADVDPDGEGVGEEEDYRQHMKKVLKKRLRLQPVRLEIEGQFDENLKKFITQELSLADNRVFVRNVPLDLSYVYSLEDKIPEKHHRELTFEPVEPQPSPMADLTRPMREQVEDHDILLFYPYESMAPLLNLLREASNDDDCISIKITLYRVAKQSHLCESLIQAAENGKDVTVLMELRARFDEANNIQWAERLEAAGCTVIYGSEGFKCHSKICQVTYHEHGVIQRLTCLGTGNFNEKTAHIYSDFMLLTAHEGIAEDGNVFFRNLSLGNLRGSYRYLGVAPEGLKPLIVRGMNREIERARAGQPAQLFMKMNSLTDRDVIDKIVEAVNAGVRVILVIRGITCIVDIDGAGDHLVIRQIVGRFLEHARVYAFGAEVDTVYLSSADMMTRNTEHRVEIAYPVLDPTCRALVLQYMNIQLADNVKARQLTSAGTWQKVATETGAPQIVAQQSLIVLAYDRARKARENQDVPLVPEATVMPPLPEILRGAPVKEIAVAEVLEEAESEAEFHIEAVGPIDVFDEDVPMLDPEPTPSLISKATEHVEAHREHIVEAIKERHQPPVAVEPQAPSLGEPQSAPVPPSAPQPAPSTTPEEASQTQPDKPTPPAAPQVTISAPKPAAATQAPAAEPAFAPQTTRQPAPETGRVKKAVGLIGEGVRILFSRKK